MKENFLVVEDDLSQAKYLSLVLQENNLTHTTVHSIENALKALKEQNFFMTFLDLNLPDGSGFQVMEHINEKGYETIIAVLSAAKEPESIIKSFKLGAVDYLIKPAEKGSIYKAIENAKRKIEGESPLFRKNLNLVAEQKLLTPREHEILELIISGENYKDIIKKLFISQNTFKVHLKNIFRKLELNGRTEVVYQFNCSDMENHFK